TWSAARSTCCSSTSATSSGPTRSSRSPRSDPVSDPSATVEVPAPERFLDLLAGFVNELRAAGLPVSMTENLDAMRALQYIPLADRAAFKTALQTTLVKHADHEKVFNILFDVYFALQPFALDDDDEAGPDGRGGGVPVPGSMPGGGAGGEASPEELAAMLMR